MNVTKKLGQIDPGDVNEKTGRQKMRIVLIGQAAFGAKVLEELLEKGENIAAVYAPPDKPGADPIRSKN